MNEYWQRLKISMTLVLDYFEILTKVIAFYKIFNVMTEGWQIVFLS